jgi:S-DNA-T family DNA segregation ATPase FtsK/SpoIIIE
MKKDEQKFIEFREFAKDESWFKEYNKSLTIPLGRTPLGRKTFLDFSEIGQLLIGGGISSGKSTFMRSLIASLVMKFSPKELKFVLGSYDLNEFKVLCRSPYLFAPILKNARELTYLTLQIVDEMEKRFDLLEKNKIRNIRAYNKIRSFKKMPYIFLILDEPVAFFPSDKEELKYLESKLIRLMQMGNAVGIQLVVSSLKLDRNHFPSLLAAHFTCRMAFQTISAKESRDILFLDGAEKLKGKGDAFLSCCTDKKSWDMQLQTPMIANKGLKDIIKSKIIH